MTTSKEVLKRIKHKKPGEIITFDEFSNLESFNAVALTLSRLFKKGTLQKMGKGLYYKPKITRFGTLKPNDNEVLKTLIKKNKKGYVSGLAAFNRLGLTSQVPNLVTISGGKSSHERKIGHLTIKFKQGDHANFKDTPFLQILDALKNIKKIPDAKINESIVILKNKILSYDKDEIHRIVYLAKSSKSSVRALLGAIIEIKHLKESSELFETLNPLTVYKLNISEMILPNKRRWKIK